MLIFFTFLAMAAGLLIVRATVIQSGKAARRFGVFVPVLGSCVAALLIIPSEAAHSPFAEAMMQADQASTAMIGSLFNKAGPIATALPAGHDFVFHLPTSRDLLAYVPLISDMHYDSLRDVEEVVLKLVLALGGLAVVSILVVVLRKANAASRPQAFLSAVCLAALYFLAFHVVVFLAPYAIGTVIASLLMLMLGALALCLLVMFAVFGRGFSSAAAEFSGTSDTVRVRVIR